MLKRVYIASKLYRAADWRLLKANLAGQVDIVSTWHDSLTVEQDDKNSDQACSDGWYLNRHQVVMQADALIAYGEAKDPLNGTMIEIGMAYAAFKPIYLVGDYPWGTWKILSHVKHVPSIKAAFDHII